MKTNMIAKSGSPQLAREVYGRMRAEATDEQVKLFAEYRLAQLDSLDERAAIGRVLADYTSRTGRCPGSWREVAPVLRATGLRIDNAGAPVDPTGLPYVLVQEGCEVELHADSKIPRR